MGESDSRPVRLITFLGTGAYHSVAYRLGDRIARPGPWIALALHELLDPPPAETVVLATEQAWTKNGAALCGAFAEAGLDGPRHVPVPVGRNETELWEQFEIVKRELRAGGPRVVVDITHGFRHQPFFAAGVIAFVRLVDREQPEVEVVYGAFENKERIDGVGEVAPVLDLTSFVDLVDWTHDLVLFLESGRLGRLSERTERLGRAVREAWVQAGKHGDRPRLEELGKAIEAFARDLQTIRTGPLLLARVDRKGNRPRLRPSSVRVLLAEVERAQADAARHVPPLADVLERVRKMAEPLVFDGDHLAGAIGQPVLAALIDLYLAMGRYVEAITALREACISAHASPAAARPGLPDFDDGEREFAEELWRRAEGGRAEGLAELRNDIDHAGYGRDADSAENLINRIRDQAEAYRRAELPEVPHAERIFVNISNHPSAEWGAEQRRAARDLAGRIEDVPFPDVGPDWSLRRLRREAERILQQLPDGTTHAMVQGEYTLTMELVRRLQQKGVRCLAATIERRVEKTEDGREIRSFRFVRFRDYPQLA